MASTGAVGGSQIDVQGLVAQLVAAERANPDKQIARQTQQVTTQISALGQLMGSLSNFRSALASLKTVDAFSTRSATTSADTIFTASAGVKATPGSYDIEVEQLAQAHQISSSAFTGGGTTVVGTGTLTLSLNGQSFSVEITDDNSTLAEIRDAINSAEDNVGIRATLVQGTGGTQLVLSSSKTGAANTIEISQTGGDGGLAQLAYSEAQPGTYTELKEARDAIAYIAGVQVTSDTNKIDGAIEGVTITLKKETEPDSPETLTVGYDTQAVTKRIQTFVDAFNALAAQMGKLRSYDAASQTAGPMLGDSLLSSIESELRNSLSISVAGQPQGFQNLASIGITVQLNGTLGIDSAKLEKAMTGNFEAVGKLFGSENGIGARLFKQVDAKLATGSALDMRSKNLTDQQKAIQKRKEDLDVRMLAVQQGYMKQFTRLDTLLSQLQVTSSYMSQQIESLANMKKG
jgi:flagellar hook-associated protein 2